MFRQDFTCPALLDYRKKLIKYGTITLFGQSFQIVLLCCFPINGLVRFRSPLLSKSRLISFPLGTEMFQFPRFCFFNLCIQLKIPHMRWVSPFGHRRIVDFSHLPVAYRSVTRPSSPLGTKAFPECPFALDSYF